MKIHLVGARWFHAGR